MNIAFITFLVIHQVLIFWSSVPLPLSFTGSDRVNLLLRHQCHNTDMESGDNELPKGSETLGLSR